MDDEDLRERVRALRIDGRSPKQIARALGVRPAAIAPIVRSIASELAAISPEPSIVECWVSAGWSVGLGVEKNRFWPDRPECGSEGSGLAGVVVARESRRSGSTVRVCGWLLDTYCLGVKDAIGPLAMNRHELRTFVHRFFTAFDGEPLEAPIELARGLVWGALEYARELGFDPAPDFGATIDDLGPPSSPSAIGFGHNGTPLYVQGPYDDVNRIMRTLARARGNDDFRFVVEASV